MTSFNSGRIIIQPNQHTRKKDGCLWCLCAAAFTSPLRCYGLFTIGTFTGSLFKIFSLLMIILTCIKLVTNSYRLMVSREIGVTFLIVFFDLLTYMLYSNESSAGLFPTYFVEHVILLFFMIVLFNNRASIFAFVKAYLYGSFFPGAMGIYQWVTVMLTGKVPNLPFANFLVTAGKDDIFLYGNYRVVGTLQDPSYYGLYMATILVLTIGVIMSEKDDCSELKSNKLILIIISIMSAACIFMSGSVASVTASLVGVIFLAYFGGLSLFKSLKYVVGIAALLLVVLTVFINVFNYNPIEELTEKLIYQNSASSVGAMYGRGVYFKQALEEFISSPLWGVGFGNLAKSSGHNSFLTILAQQGLIGFVLHLLLLIIYPFANFKYYRNSKSYIYCIAMLVGMLALIMGYDCMYKMDPSIVVVAMVYCSRYNWDRTNGVI